MAIPSANKAYLDALSSVTKLVTQVGIHTQMRQTYVYSLRGVMEICRYSTLLRTADIFDHRHLWQWERTRQYRVGSL